MSKKNQFISMKQVSVKDSFFSPIQKTVVDVMIPYQEKALHDEIPDVRKSHVIENMKIAAGESAVCALLACYVRCTSNFH